MCDVLPILYSGALSILPRLYLLLLWGQRTRPLFLCSRLFSFSSPPLRLPSAHYTFPSRLSINSASTPWLTLWYLRLHPSSLSLYIYLSLYISDKDVAQCQIHTLWVCLLSVSHLSRWPGCSCALRYKSFSVNLLKTQKLLMYISNCCNQMQTYFLPIPIAWKSPNWFIFKFRNQFAKCKNM